MSKRTHDESSGSSTTGATGADPLGKFSSTVEAVRAAVDKHLAPVLEKGGELAQLQSQLQTEAASAAAHLQQEAAAVRRSEQKLQDEVRRMSDHAVQMADVITLNVGGTKFTTSKATLTSRPSFLAAMFSGRHALQPSDDGSYFIDRDPKYFRDLLNYLRCGAMTVPDGNAAKAELLREVDFFALTDLALELRAPVVQLDLGDQITAERAAETSHRAAFASGDVQRRKDLAQHVGLVSIFGDEGVASSLVFEGESARRFPTLLTTKLNEAKAAQRVVVESFEIFRKNFSQRNPNFLQRLSPLLETEPILIAGGAVLHALTLGDTRTGNGIWERYEDRGRKSDVDVFLCTRSPTEASRLCRAIYFALAVDDEKWMITRAKGVVNMTLFGEGTNERTTTVQVVLRLYDSPSEVLHGFDIDCICCGFDSKHVWALPRCLRALKSGVNILNPLHAWPNRPTYEYRLVKYASRGFAIAVPGFDGARADWLTINATELCDLSGLSRLLKLVLAVTSSTISYKDRGGTRALPRSHLNGVGLEVVDPLAISCLDASEFLSEADIQVKALHCGEYDDDKDMIYPSVFHVGLHLDGMGGAAPVSGANGIPRQSLTIEIRAGCWTGPIHFASETRLLAWSEICDAGQAVEWANARVARKLDDAWDASKRSREYLNAADGELEPRYYVHAQHAAA